MFVTSPSIVTFPAPVMSFLFSPPVNVTTPSLSIPSIVLTAPAFVTIFPVLSTPILSVATIAFALSLLFVNVPTIDIFD